MKSFKIFLFLFGATFFTSAQDHNWLVDMEKAQQIAKEEHKSILMSFAGSDWCKPCIKLTKEVFETSEFEMYAQENLVLLLLDFPRLKKNAISDEQLKHNELLAAQYNQEGVFPLVVILNTEGKLIGKAGYIPGGPKPFIKYLNQIME